VPFGAIKHMENPDCRSESYRWTLRERRRYEDENG